MLKFTIRTLARILTYILAAITLAAAWSGYVSPHIWALPQVLVLIYPYLAILTFCVGVVWLCCHRFITAGICALALIGGSTSLLLNFPIATEKKPHTGEKIFTVMTYNIMHGVDAKERPASQNRTFSYILHSNADIICLQELITFHEVPQLTAELGDSILAVYPYQCCSPSSDITLLSKYPVKSIQVGKGIYYNNFEQFELNISGRKVNLIGVHLASYNLTETERRVVTDIRGPRSAKSSISELKGSILTKMKGAYRDRAVDAQSVRSTIDEVKGPLIVCGDFNDVPASWAYRLIRGTDLRDAYTDTGLGMMVTYNQHVFWFHIDQILYRPSGLKALSIRKDNVDYSDHFPQIATFALTNQNQSLKQQ